ncbi:MAG: hypothetical protein ACI92Z_001526 [Paracoccaceae bacterium]|jgi:hypothetical protein
MSGWAPKYFPEILVKYANTMLKKKILFGSDWPAFTPDLWLKDFENIEVRDEVRPLILKENARFLGNLAHYWLHLARKRHDKIISTNRAGHRGRSYGNSRWRA